MSEDRAQAAWMDPSRFSMVRQHRRMLANMNVYLERDARVLDFGCGAGHVVYEYRDAGFDAYGFDITSYVQLRAPEDERWFRFALSGKPPHVPDYGIQPSFYKIPFEDDAFDFVCSASVFEHVMDYEMALSEVARVLRPGGVAIHSFPARYSPVEPHIFVPFGGALQGRWWYFLWALAGIRNQFQRGLGAAEVARLNSEYARTGLNYLTVKEILAHSSRHFREWTLLPHLWEMGDHGSLSVKGMLIHGIPVFWRIFRWLYNRCGTVVLFLRK